MCALSCVELANVVGVATPFKKTEEPGVNPLPSTASVNAGLPAVTLGGSMDVIIGAAATLNVCGFEAAPSGFTATTLTCAAASACAPRTCDASVVPLRKSVGRAAPFHVSTAPATNPLPSATSVKSAAPAITADGSRDAITGPFAIVSCCRDDVAPLGFTTATEASPGCAIRA